MGVVLDAATVALKQAVVDHIKAKERGKQPHIGQRYRIAAELGAIPQRLGDRIQRIN